VGAVELVPLLEAAPPQAATRSAVATAARHVETLLSCMAAA